MHTKHNTFTNLLWNNSMVESQKQKKNTTKFGKFKNKSVIIVGKRTVNNIQGKY